MSVDWATTRSWVSIGRRHTLCLALRTGEMRIGDASAAAITDALIGA